jgi:glucose-6-phosphate 1-dehydrogenase
MSNQESDAIVFFGASGDLAYKQIFPSLLRLAGMPARSFKLTV